jgi:hypothetical protein
MQFYVTNDVDRDIDDLARVYDDHAGIEPLIAELKNGFGIGKVSTSSFGANEAAFLFKLPVAAPARQPETIHAH